MQGSELSKVPTGVVSKCGKTKNTKKKWNVQLLQKIISFCKLNVNPSSDGARRNKDKGGGLGLGFGIKIFQIPRSRFVLDNDSENWEWFPVQ